MIPTHVYAIEDDKYGTSAVFLDEDLAEEQLELDDKYCPSGNGVVVEHKVLTWADFD